MRHWLLTSTTYGTWLPGDVRGSVTSVRDLRRGETASRQRREHSVVGDAFEPELPELRRSALTTMKARPVWLTTEHAQVLLQQFRETTTYRGWQLLAVAIMANHFHSVVRVEGDPEPQKVLTDLKAYGSRSLNRRFGEPEGGRWWTSGGSKRKLSDQRAVAAAVNYVLHKQPAPLVTWSPDQSAGEPGA